MRFLSPTTARDAFKWNQQAYLAVSWILSIHSSDAFNRFPACFLLLPGRFNESLNVDLLSLLLSSSLQEVAKHLRARICTLSTNPQKKLINGSQLNQTAMNGDVQLAEQYLTWHIPNTFNQGLLEKALCSHKVFDKPFVPVVSGLEHRIPIGASFVCWLPTAQGCIHIFSALISGKLGKARHIHVISLNKMWDRDRFIRSQTKIVTLLN